MFIIRFAPNCYQPTGLVLCHNYQVSNDFTCLWHWVEAYFTHTRTVYVSFSPFQYFVEVRQLRDSTYKPDLTAYPVLTADQLEAKRKKEKKAMADMRRQRIMNMMSKMQKNFIKDNKSIWEETALEQPTMEEGSK